MELKPMLAKDGKGGAFPSGERWVIEPKFDGWRFLFWRTEDGVRSVAGRNGSDRTGQPAAIEEALRFLPGDTIVDAELVVFGEKSPAVSTALAHPGWTSERGQALVAVVFDVLRVNGTDVIRQSWERRREFLDVMARGFDNEVLRVPTPEQASQEVHAKHLALGFEGSVCKQVDSIYRPGLRSDVWRKYKPQLTADVTIVGLEKGEGSWGDGLGAFTIELANGMVTSCAIPTKKMRATVTKNPGGYLGRMIEIRHHGEMKDSGLVRHPVFSRMRPDLEEE